LDLGFFGNLGGIFGNYLWNSLGIVNDCLDLWEFIDLFVKILGKGRRRKEEIQSLEVREASSSHLKIN
jgi:hypothetical protein